MSKVESLCAAANIFVGQSESPLVIRPYLAGLTQAQLFTVMTSGMAGVAGTILAAYASMGIKIDYLLAASFMAAPGGILMAKIIMPDTKSLAPRTRRSTASRPPTRSRCRRERQMDAGEPLPDATHDEEKPANIIMAAAQGAQTGVKLAVAVGAMVLAFVALVALANGILGGVGGWFGYPDLSFQAILGAIFKPVMYLLNVPWNEAGAAGGFFGEKIVLNEFVAYIDLGKMQASLSPHTVAVVTFALCGFANFSSIAIQMAVDRQPRAQPAPDDRQARPARAGGGESRQSDVGGAGRDADRLALQREANQSDPGDQGPGGLDDCRRQVEIVAEADQHRAGAQEIPGECWAALRVDPAQHRQAVGGEHHRCAAQPDRVVDRHRVGTGSAPE